MVKRREGFTLVELLIVIIIIAILAGMMLLATSATVSSAEATKIVNDLRMLHSAVLAYYIDNDGLPSLSPNGSPTPLSPAAVKSLSAYIDREVDSTRYDEIYIVQAPSAGDSRVLLGIKYTRNVNNVSSSLAAINKRLASTAGASGLFGLDGSVFQPTDTTDTVYIWLK